MADELPEITPFNAVYQSEKYYDIEPQRATEIIKKVGGGIADIMLPQDATDVMMMAVSPLFIFKKVSKILSRADELEAMAKSFINASGTSYSKKGREFLQESKNLRDNVPKKDMDIYNDYAKQIRDNPSEEAIQSKKEIDELIKRFRNK
jgi:hypothetical protein